MHKGYIILFFLLIFVLIGGCVSQEEDLKNKLDKANYCETKQDCAYVGSKCPFGCYVYVNKAELNQIKPLFDDYQSECAYGCLACSEIACFENKCVSNC